MYPCIGIKFYTQYETPVGKSEQEAARIVDQFIAEELRKFTREAKRRFAEQHGAKAKEGGE